MSQIWLPAGGPSALRDALVCMCVCAHVLICVFAYVRVCRVLQLGWWPVVSEQCAGTQSHFLRARKFGLIQARRDRSCNLCNPNLATASNTLDILLYSGKTGANCSFCTCTPMCTGKYELL